MLNISWHFHLSINSHGSKMEFVVLKVNGVSVEHLSEDEAKQTFNKKNEPIQIEMQLQTKNSSNTGSVGKNCSPFVLTLRCQTISSSECIKNTQSQETQTNDFSKHNKEDLEKNTNDRLIDDEHVIFDQCLAPDIDIEEVTLRKSASNELLGLSIIYSRTDSVSKTNSGSSKNGVGSASVCDNDMCTEVYISHVQKDSVAGRDGRLRQGDQILQINGKDIKTKEETESLIAENNNAVTLLVSRYLYTDEDDFNDPSLVVDLDEEENDETDDEEGEEIYVDNNSAYENCIDATNNILVNSLEKAFVSQEKYRILNEKHSQTIVETCEDDETKLISLVKKHFEKSSNASTLKMVADDKTKEEYKCTQRENSIPDHNSRKNCFSNAQEQHKNVDIKKSTKCFNDVNFTAIDSETEHIYETIPEGDSEAEPFYCSPYESSTYVNAVDTCSSSTSTNGARQKQRVEQWLGLCSTSSNILFPRRTIPLRSSNLNFPKEVFVGKGTNKSDTVKSIVTVTTNGSSSSGGGESHRQEEQDNSSSAYNTGGSNVSANQTLNEATCLAKNLQEEASSSTPLATRAIKKLQLSKDKEKIHGKITTIGAQGLIKANCGPRTGSEELSVPDTLIRMYPPLSSSQAADKKHFNKESTIQTCVKSQVAHSDHLPRALSVLCPHFTAPSLGQYRFVSSQEVTTLHPGALINETFKKHQVENNFSQQAQQQQPPMVWKVKRRPDGTRYIVRRPAVTVFSGNDSELGLSNRGRGLRNIEHTRNEATTTEDDTISEVKTGRYWSKEERKKHVERARERRLQQQQQLEQQFFDGGTICISEKIARLQQHRKNRQKNQVFKIQHQDLQFGGNANVNPKMVPSQTKSGFTVSAPGTHCDLQQPLIGIKQQAALAKTNHSSQPPHPNIQMNDSPTANAIPKDENSYEENCSSP